MYSTPEEIDETRLDEHFTEFLSVMKFLNEDPEAENRFLTVWKDYSMRLREMTLGDTTILSAKDAAEDAMYQSVCRTERVSAAENADIIDDSDVHVPLEVLEQDIQSYVQAQELLDEIGANQLAEQSVQEVLYQIAWLVKEYGRWSGCASELLNLVDDHSVAPNKLMQKITCHYYDVFHSMGISYEQKREAGLRRITFTYNPTEDTTLQDDSGDDDSDGSDDTMLHPYHSLLSGSAAYASEVADTCV